MHRSLRLSLVCSSLVLGFAWLGATPDAAGQPKLPSSPSPTGTPPSLNMPTISKVHGVRPGWPEGSGSVHPTIPIRVVGNNFGASQGKHRIVVEIDGKRIPLAVASWSGTAIGTTMPSPQDLGIWDRTGSQTASFSIEEKPTGEKGYSRVGLSYKGTIAWHNKGDQDGDGVNGIAQGGTDCDEYDAQRFPTNAEIADFLGHDEDCDNNTFGTRDADGDGHTDARAFNIGGRRGDDCDDTRREVRPGQIEACNHRDDNCNGLVDEELLNCPH